MIHGHLTSLSLTVFDRSCEKFKFINRKLNHKTYTYWKRWLSAKNNIHKMAVWFLGCWKLQLVFLFLFLLCHWLCHGPLARPTFLPTIYFFGYVWKQWCILYSPTILGHKTIWKRPSRQKFIWSIENVVARHELDDFKNGRHLVDVFFCTYPSIFSTLYAFIFCK